MPGLRSAIGHRLREAALWPRLLGDMGGGPGRGRGPKVLFLPSDAPSGASLLRAHEMARALRGLGWRAHALPFQLEAVQRDRLIAAFDPDLLVFQQCRHPLNRAELARGRPFAFDIDDADFHDPALTGAIAAMCREARAVIAGSRYIAQWCREQGGATHVVWTGTPATPGPWPDHHDRAPILAWAQSGPLTYERELEHVARLQAALQARGVEFRLRLYGLDSEGAVEEARRRTGAGDRLEAMPHLPYRAYLASLREAAVGLSPIMTQTPFSRGKSFGKVLGYLDGKVPAVVSDAADHALFFTPESGVVTNDFDTWVEETAALLADPARRAAMAEAAHRDFLARLTTGAAAARLDGILRAAL